MANDIGDVFHLNLPRSPVLRRVLLQAFPMPNDVTYSDLEEAKELCQVLDGYFAKKTNRRYLANIGAESSPPTEVKVWCDDVHIYITEQTFNEILKLQDCNKKISIKIKRTLAKNDLIKFYKVGEKERPEYSVHIQKPLFDNHKDRRRFLALKRVSCARFDLFPNIDSIACKRAFYVETDLVGNVLARH